MSVNVRGSNDLNSASLGFLFALVVLVLNLIVIHLKMWKQAGSWTRESKSATWYYSKLLWGYFKIWYGERVFLCKTFTGSMSFELYCSPIFPKIVQSIALIRKHVLQENQLKIFCGGFIFRFKIPTRSSDVNYIANMFHAMRKKYR